MLIEAEHGQEDIIFDDQIDGLESHVVHFEGVLHDLSLGSLTDFNLALLAPVRVPNIAAVLPPERRIVVVLQVVLLDLLAVVGAGLNDEPLEIIAHEPVLLVGINSGCAADKAIDRAKNHDYAEDTAETGDG